MILWRWLGSLTYETKIDKEGIEKGLKSITNSVKNGGTKIKNIVAAIGITKLVGTAFQTINNSLDSAISRIDIMSNFPKVMNNLGISSEKSTNAIKKLSEGLKGIPTKLDDASLAVQKFTSINNDVEKSTDYFLAINNALLAGGASAEIQTNALEQLSQMYAIGTVDAQAWRSVQTAMPAQLQQVAKSLGYTSSAVGGDFYNAMKSGKISMEKFMQQIVKLNKEGTGQYASFAEQAKSATGGLQTSIANAKTAISRGVAEIISSTNGALEKTKFKSIGNIISQIGSISEKVLKKIAANISKIDINKIINEIQRLFTVYMPKTKSILNILINLLKNTWSWANNNTSTIKTMIAIIISLIAVTKTYKAVLVTIKGINIIKYISGVAGAFLKLIPTINSGKDAMMLFNLVTKANPVGVLVTAIAALCAGLTILAVKQSSATRESKELASEMANSKKEMEDYRKNIDKNTYANLSHIESAKKLRQELSEIVDENGKVKDGYQGRVSFILNELNSALGTEYKLNGDIIESYKSLQNEIDTTIEKKKAQIILQGEEEKYKNAIENQEKAVEDQRRALESLGMSYDDAKKKIENYNNAREKLYGSKQGQELTEEEYNVFWSTKNKGEIKSLEKLVSAYDDATARVKQYTEDGKKYADLYAKYTEGKFEEIANTVTVTTEDWTSKSLKELNGSISEQSKVLNIYKDMYKDVQNEVTEKNLQQAQKNLDDLASELVKRTQTLENLGQDEVDAWKNIATQSYSSYSTEISKMSPEMQQKIQEATGIIAAGTPQMQEKAEELGRKTVEEFDKSSEAKQKAFNTIVGYMSGLEDSQKRELLRQAGIEDVDIVLEELDRNDLSEENGRNILEGLWKGLQNGTWKDKIIGAASGLAQAVNKAFTGKDGWDEHSPSKKMKKYAEYYIQPISDTINKKKNDIVGTAQNLISSMNNKIMSEMQKAVAIETGSINAKASVKSNNSMLNVLKATFNIDGSVDIDGNKAGRLIAPSVCRTIKAGGLA